MKRKVAFVDHSFHKKSMATSFLMDMLGNESEAEVFWDESWINGPRVDISQLGERGFDTLILFQLIDRYSPAELKGSGCRNIILIPMYDMSGGWSDLYWLQYRDFRILNFSKTLHVRLHQLGMQSKYFQYFLPPATDLDPDAGERAGLHGFFWQRTADITWEHIRRLIEGSDFRSFHLHLAVDPPGYNIVTPTDEETRKYNITLSEWFADREDYFRATSRVNVFFAPRLYEGIGMSFVEAMAHGKFIVAADRPTMNEYVIHGVNGLLYDPSDPRPLQFPAADIFAGPVREYAARGYGSWCGQKAELLNFIFADMPGKKFWSLLPTVGITAVRHVAARLRHHMR